MPDPKQELAVEEFEAYWAVDPTRGEKTYIAPALRFFVRNRSDHEQRSIQANAVFRRASEEKDTWGSDWQQVTPARKPLAPGQRVLVAMKSDTHYYSTGAPDSMFGHALFKDATAELYLRAGASGWVKMAAGTVERRIGSRAALELLAPSPGSPPR